MLKFLTEQRFKIGAHCRLDLKRIRIVTPGPLGDFAPCGSALTLRNRGARKHNGATNRHPRAEPEHGQHTACSLSSPAIFGSLTTGRLMKGAAALRPFHPLFLIELAPPRPSSWHGTP